MNNTQRTDAEVAQLRIENDAGPFVTAKFARELEERVQQLEKQLKVAKGEADFWFNYGDSSDS